MTTAEVIGRPSRGWRELADRPWPRFLARRLGRLVISVWLLVTASFAMIHLIPGDPVRAALGLTAPPSLIAQRRRQLGLDHPIAVQYWRYVTGVLHGNLGQSTTTGLPASQVISDRLPATLELGALAFLVIIVLSIAIGVGMAVVTHSGRRRRTELTFTTVAGLLDAVPGFLLAVGFVSLFAVIWPILPAAGRTGPMSYVLPVLALSVGPTASLSRVVRVETLSVLGQDYVRTARAKRLPPRLVYLRHALPNSLTAALTLGGLLLSSVIIGSVFVETIFTWPGLGQIVVNAVKEKDYSLTQGMVLFYGAAVLLVNIVVDVLLAVLDPRSTIREN